MTFAANFNFKRTLFTFFNGWKIQNDFLPFVSLLLLCVSEKCKQTVFSLNSFDSTVLFYYRLELLVNSFSECYATENVLMR
jgi:hypothetical protein